MIKLTTYAQRTAFKTSSARVDTLTSGDLVEGYRGDSIVTVAGVDRVGRMFRVSFDHGRPLTVGPGAHFRRVG